jgi:hypothetical protein
MRTLLFSLLFVVFTLASTDTKASTGSFHTDVRDSGERSSAALDATLAPSSILFVGGALLVLGGVLRRRLRT